MGLGEAVAVHGLQGAPQHNGKRGVVVGAADPTSGRYAVQIDGEPADKALGLKIGNLELVEAANARAAGGGGAATAAGGGGTGSGRGGAKKSGLPNIQVRNTSGRPL